MNDLTRDNATPFADAVTPTPAEPYWSSDSAAIYKGDILSVLPALPTGSVDAVIADPPYSSGGVSIAERKRSTRTKYVSGSAGDIAHENPDFPGDQRDQRSWTFWSTLWMTEALRLTKPGGSILVFTDWRQLPSTTDAMQAAGWTWRGVVNWVKPRGRSRPIRGGFWNQAEYAVWGVNGSIQKDYEVYLPGAIEARAPVGANRIHQTEKPVDPLLTTLVRVAPPGGLILDPFTGSGSTGVAAQMQGRRFIGIEITDHYAKVAADRLSRPTLATAPDTAGAASDPEQPPAEPAHDAPGTAGDPPALFVPAPRSGQ
ncbi:site-specific DNA-methyltransferase [Planomonospora sp. ID82291]|uniref:DNA-methyltransferase n=1 Tax=Planomonospora sp. ID82291 TaxID=2738136 RepID=UPI0018C359E1|nr:site-specific DNA-methyltransferase [Planomonospora sp. ID82291]MBG0818270.1 site-specific DNA-methyltransferase [Planomonospora sp. ID82291]